VLMPPDAEFKRALAGSFDHARALGCALSESGMARTLDRGLDRFVRGGTAWRFEHDPAKPPPSLVEVAKQALAMVRPHVRTHWLERVQNFTTQDVTRVTRRVSKLSVVASTFVEQVVEINRGRVLDDPATRSIQPVGLLAYDGTTYRFRYVRNALAVTGFVPLIGFPELDRAYSSQRLFPLFAQRVMAPRRPDFLRYVESLDLTEDADPWEQLTRSEGRRAGDTIMVLPEPIVDNAGMTSANFLVHGIRHMLPEECIDVRLSALRRGDHLALVPEPTNPVNPRAIHTVDGERIALGWVPDLLLDYVHTVTDHGPYALVVQHVNGPEAPAHLRLLVRLTGTVPAGFRAFSGPMWEPVE
jgi:hypothetical protein